MNKLKILIVLSIYLAICFGGSCVNIYQETDQTTGEILVEGLINRQDFYYDNGEVDTYGYFESRVTLKKNDKYEVSGNYEINLNTEIQHAHLCRDVYYQKAKKSEQYTFTRQRESSRVGQDFSAKEVTPDLVQPVKDLLHEQMVQAIQEKKTPYIINQLNELAINYKPRQIQEQQY